MPTTADYLNNLLVQRDNLADNLVTKGVTASKTELLDTLVPKVLQIEESSGSNGLNIFTQTNEPETKEGIWLQTSDTYNRVVVDSSTYLSGTKLTSSSADFPQHPDALVGAAGGGYYHELTNSIYSFVKTGSSSTAKLDLCRYDLTSKAYTLVSSDTIGATFTVRGAVLVGDELFVITRLSSSDILGKVNLLTLNWTSLYFFMPYFITTYGELFGKHKDKPIGSF